MSKNLTSSDSPSEPECKELDKLAKSFKLFHMMLDGLKRVDAPCEMFEDITREMFLARFFQVSKRTKHADLKHRLSLNLLNVDFEHSKASCPRHAQVTMKQTLAMPI